MSTKHLCFRDPAGRNEQGITYGVSKNCFSVVVCTNGTLFRDRHVTVPLCFKVSEEKGPSLGIPTLRDWMSRGDLPRPLYRFPKAHPQEHQTGEKSPRLILVRFWCPWGGDCCHDCPTIRTNRLAEIVIDVPFASRYNDDYTRERILTSRRHVLVDTTTTFEHSRMLRRKIVLA